MSGVPRLGAWHRSDGAVVWRVWAPSRTRLEIVLYGEDGATERQRVPLARSDACFEGVLPRPQGRVLYKIAVDGDGPFPDPWSRAQPFGVHGPSEVVRADFAWHDGDWRGIPAEDAVIYEVHVGTATPEGTFDALISRLGHVRALGANLVELLPVASFPGARNWGYDGVSLFAPAAIYGGPDGLRRLVNAAHRTGLGVLLDVVYNHFGPDGNYLRCYEPSYFTDRHKTPWGDGNNYDGPRAATMRELVLSNAEMWIRDFHMDGLRLDATHAILDDSPIHILREVGERARAAAPNRSVLVIAEDERNAKHLVVEDGFGLDGVWADDFHHAVRRLFTGDRTGCCEDFSGTAAELAQIVARGWIYEGQESKHHGRPRGTPSDGIPYERFVFCLQNHDQIGNRAFGERLYGSMTADAYRAASALLLFAPETPLIFMGQEWNARTPFLYFTDHGAALGAAVTKGRQEELRKLGLLGKAEPPDPQSPTTFEQSKLDWTELERPEHQGVFEWYRALLRLRAEHPCLRERRRDSVQVTTPVEGVLSVERSAGDGRLQLLLVPDARPFSMKADAHLVLASDGPRFGGSGRTQVRDGGIVSHGPVAIIVESGRPPHHH